MQLKPDIIIEHFNKETEKVVWGEYFETKKKDPDKNNWEKRKNPWNIVNKETANKR